MQVGQRYRGGFALPTVLIASVVMLIVLSVSVTSVATVRNSLKVQYYEQLAKIAGEAGVAYAKACLAKNGNVPLWTDEKPLTPATDCAGNQLLGPAVQAIIVAGGGGGGAGIGGGGGGGGVIQDDSVAISTGGYGIVVGAGGAGGLSKSSGSNGGNSSFAGRVAIGGGGGGGRVGGTTYTPAGDGGSGGGGNGTYDAGTGTGAPGGIGETGQGNDGGTGSASSASPYYAGNGAGGGGAGSAGGAASGLASGEGSSGAGGNGILSDISGEQLYYGAGGSGGRWGTGPVGTPGITGGGLGGSPDAVPGGAGLANTGAGGGGGSSGDGLGGAGGSGVVVVRYANNGSVTATGGTTYTNGPYKIHRFNSSATFNVTATGTSTCPSDPRCSVTVDENLRSSFSMPRPAVGSDGRAITLPNTGYVELLRASTGQVWRTYRQPSVQVAVVPDLCSGAASSPLGWSNAVISSNQSSLPNATTAQTITLSNDDLNAGRMYFRKDFTVTQSGTYTVSAQTASSADVAEVYVDGSLRTTARNQVKNGTVTLSAGCHTITVRLTNKTLLPRHSQFTAAIQNSGSEPIVATDSSWRASAGSSVHYSDVDFYVDSTIWTGATTIQHAQLSSSSWSGASYDPQTQLITSSCNTACPPSSSTYFRDGKSFTLADNADVLVSALCDDDCAVYVDGNLVIGSSPWSNINQQTITLTAGTHHIGARLYNSGSTANPSKLAIAVYDKSNNTLLTRTDASWLTSSDIWTSGTNTDNDPMSYEASFRPSPLETADPATYDVLVVAGGGGGGGNCNTCGGAGGGGGGGVRFQQDVTATVGTRTVTVGAGGSAGAGGASRSNGGNGGNSAFGSLTATGGGGGGAQNGVPGNNGGSGGGGSGGGSPAPGAGGNSVSGQGYAGGDGLDQTTGNFNGGGGGGATGFGMIATQPRAGSGGPGLITYLTGSGRIVGAGGGAGTYSTYVPGSSDPGAGDGAASNVNSGVGYSASTNTGSGGGGANGNNQGRVGGTGGSGVVIVRVKTGSMNISVTGSPLVTTTTVRGVSYTVYTFNTSGSWTITSIN